MKKYKSGRYSLEKESDLFSNNSNNLVEVKLTEKEAEILFKNKLYEKLGFVGWSFLDKN
jgi:hypothetical protein